MSPSCEPIALDLAVAQRRGMSYPLRMGNGNKLRAGTWGLWVIIAAGIQACGGDDFRDKNRPDTFADSCEIGDDTCAAPFECLENPDRTGPTCTLSCTSDNDCPSWKATGHCPGFTQSTCSSGVCQNRQCK